MDEATALGRVWSNPVVRGMLLFSGLPLEEIEALEDGQGKPGGHGAKVALADTIE